jgi:hypothetical protein
MNINDNKTPPGTDKATTGGLGTLERLPPEVIDRVLKQMDDPFASAGFAQVSKLGMQFTNQRFLTLVPPAHRKTSNRLGEWVAQFRLLPPEMQQVLKATSVTSPWPNIFFSIENDTIEKLYNTLDKAMCHLMNGRFEPARTYFALLASDAKLANVLVPDATGLLVELGIEKLENGKIRIGKDIFTLLNAHAKEAGLTVPDAREVLADLVKDRAETKRLGYALGILAVLTSHAEDVDLPMPDILPFLLSLGLETIRAGDLANGREIFSLLTSYAKKAGLPIPDGTHLLLNLARESYSAQKRSQMEQILTILRNHAKSAGVAVPDGATQLVQ